MSLYLLFVGTLGDIHPPNSHDIMSFVFLALKHIHPILMSCVFFLGSDGTAQLPNLYVMKSLFSINQI